MSCNVKELKQMNFLTQQPEMILSAVVKKQLFLACQEEIKLVEAKYVKFNIFFISEDEVTFVILDYTKTMLYFSNRKCFQISVVTLNIELLELLNIEIASLLLHYFPHSTTYVWIHVSKYRLKLKCMLTSACLSNAANPSKKIKKGFYKDALVYLCGERGVVANGWF